MRSLLPIAIILSFATGETAKSAGSSTIQDQLFFEHAELKIIQKNQFLSVLHPIDQKPTKAIIDTTSIKRNTHPRAGIDLRLNPDLVGSDSKGRVSPEWISLLDRAKAKLNEVKRSNSKAPRSAEGSIEFIEMLRKAKEAKEAPSK
jgi:hypothetical protein